MLSTTRPLQVDDLLPFHETDVAAWARTCTDDELARVCDVADFLTLSGPATPSGGSMTFAKASALAAVYVCEGKPRNLALSRRDLKVIVPDVVDENRRPLYLIQQTRPERFAVGDDAIDFWAVDPAKARRQRDQLAADFVKRESAKTS